MARRRFRARLFDLASGQAGGERASELRDAVEATIRRLDRDGELKAALAPIGRLPAAVAALGSLPEPFPVDPALVAEVLAAVG